MENILQVINANDVEPNDYEPRPTAKAVVVNEKNEILLFSNLLIGGGIDDGENADQALARECLEEAGAVVEVIQPLGMVIQYRDALKKKYEVHGYLARFVKKEMEATTSQVDELDKKAEWKSFDEAVRFLQEKIAMLESADKNDYQGDSYQSKLYNAMTSLLFIEKAKEILG